jgi:HSP20 family molecular chaperone IbpA
MDAGNEKAMFAPHLVMRKVVRDIDSAPTEGRTSPIETLRYSLGEWPWVPELEVFEEDGWLMIHVDLPGVRPEDVSIAVAGDRVQVAGERRRASSLTRKDLHAPEPTYGGFNRSVRLPEGAAVAGLAWVFENGVLQIGVPVSANVLVEQVA